MWRIRARVNELKRGQKFFTREKERKTRGDSISTEQNNSFSTNFWSYEGSRPLGDKKDVIKKRTEKKQHIEHAKHVLEKIQRHL